MVSTDTIVNKAKGIRIKPSKQNKTKHRKQRQQRKWRAGNFEMFEKGEVADRC